MMKIVEANGFEVRISPWRILTSEWKWWAFGAILSFVLASLLMTGWPEGIFPNLSYPYTYSGDGLSHSWMTLRVIEGWVFENDRSGYPFGSSFFDYPGSDFGNLVVLKVLGWITGEYHSAINLFFLLSFSIVFVSSFCVLRAFGLRQLLAVCASLLFSFLPFHFLRLGHLFYLWYFVVPWFFYICFILFFRADETFTFSTLIRKKMFLWSTIIVLACFGVYYALFGVLMLGIVALSVGIRTSSMRKMAPALLAAVIITVGVIINVAPNIVYKKQNGTNTEVAVRSPSEAEVYGFKLMQLLMPRPGHRSEYLASLSATYGRDYPLVNENSTASLGFVGSLGFVFVFFIMLSRFSGKAVDIRLSFLSMIVIFLFLLGTIGGLGAVFSAFLSSSIRGWNRISVFISFGVITVFFLAVQNFIERNFSPRRSSFVISFLAFGLLVLGMFDQTTPACHSCSEKTKLAFDTDRDFIGRIEGMLPSGAAVYQLPYMPFPEVAPKNRLHTYDLAAGFLHSKSLRWSYAGMKGREGDLFYRALAQESIEKQIDVISRLGFSGVYIDRRGFEDNGDSLIARLTVLLGEAPSLQRADGEIVFFRLKSNIINNTHGLSAAAIYKIAGFTVDHLGSRYAASLSEGINFTKNNWPEFLRDVKGVSGSEPWGRWSDANLHSSVEFHFLDPLPSQFDLILYAKPFGRSGTQEITVRVGKKEYHIILKPEGGEIRVPVNLLGERVDLLEFIPNSPISPHELGMSADSRKLGIGFVYLKFHYN